MEALVFNIQRFAIHDGPGIRTTVFLKGCPLSCWWCHNPEGIRFSRELMYTQHKCIHCQSCVVSCKKEALSFKDDILFLNKDLCSLCGACTEICPTTALKMVGTQISCEDILKELEKDTTYFDQSGGGVTFSGGEPLSQIDFLLEILPELKRRAVHVAIDTSGYAKTEDLKKVLPYVDLFLYDLKVIDEKKHIKHTGVSNRIIKENLKFLLSERKSLIIRLPIIPSVNDSDEDIQKTIDFLNELRFRSEINLLPYHNVNEKYDALWKIFTGTNEKISKERLNLIKQLFENNGFKVKIGG
ncbi:MULTISPECIES: glycyl-radical enzyme activating protein [Pseudothermotoga]|jgi:pyruvate formate lyase activating enzyme|uniref:Glycyl-radical enzyme activating protein family n=1 Tax=Pseudothermotoga lettingae (strain ATCC BAA-301 / DSM 14385 / NBRC 107922 / TMO) TaxID=416591 RepID=A8F6C3_PSELT|nr:MULTISPECIES: glycyl-radical enzyme activating protein [Pseudothermotoga]ABV33707.1 glycyl-radical enzyme activating protein family [Pseudothermotoga lettingae TMO]KUK20302.1 MAG: Glycyl-radical enzyme activating protein family [Pseudothermotoga lettingae]MDI3494754.1 pyruvate formate lyase activating enzyme [Pseudothermotoga sp.]MDK2885418.1 pyruvate formate lyase activating enzyme [Pseudothermotoga sp.]GLI49375.1 glycyl-radical enzyme activating protein [Pseudothermotoga lettingae TMO]